MERVTFVCDTCGVQQTGAGTGWLPPRWMIVNISGTRAHAHGVDCARALLSKMTIPDGTTSISVTFEVTTRHVEK